MKLSKFWLFVVLFVLCLAGALVIDARRSEDIRYGVCLVLVVLSFASGLAALLTIAFEEN